VWAVFCPQTWEKTAMNDDKSPTPNRRIVVHLTARDKADPTAILTAVRNALSAHGMSLVISDTSDAGKSREAITQMVRRASERLSTSGLGLASTSELVDSEDDRTVVRVHILSPEGSADLTLADDDLRSEPAIRFQMLNAFTDILRRRSQQLTATGQEASRT